jgi:dUTP pyrophosphatase
MDAIQVKAKKLVPWAVLPQYDTAGAAGCDIQLAIQEEEILYPGEVTSFPIGLMLKIPAGYEAQIRSRAGMARKGIIVANAPATIDSDHQTEITVLLLNTTDKPVKITPGQKVAQMVFAPVVKAAFDEAF